MAFTFLRFRKGDRDAPPPDIAEYSDSNAPSTNRNALLVTVIDSTGGVVGTEVNIPDGQDVALGSTTDAAVTTDAPGTVNAHLRGLVALLASVITTVSTIVHLKVGEQFASVAEDNVGGVIGIAKKPVATAAYGWSAHSNFSAATKANAKPTPGIIRSARVSNANAAVRFFQIHNKASAPAGGDVPIVSVPIPAGTAAAPGSIPLDENMLNIFLSLGVSWAISTTVGTFTDSATSSEHTVLLTYA